MKRLSNPYDSLMVDRLNGYKPVEATASCTVSTGRDELVVITTALLPDGFWCYGYYVVWLNTRSSLEHPSPDRGRFRSQRDAQLHCIGFFKHYLEFFTPENQLAILDFEKSLAQKSLFD